MLYLIMRMYLITNHVINKRKQVFLTAACVCRPWQRAPPSRRAAVRHGVRGILYTTTTRRPLLMHYDRLRLGRGEMIHYDDFMHHDPHHYFCCLVRAWRCGRARARSVIVMISAGVWWGAVWGWRLAGRRMHAWYSEMIWLIYYIIYYSGDDIQQYSSA